ncbi:uncharacterized protein CC84DRAFT_939371 [Paraphaeosphaeria sporulosa]|uniref:Uncharacterized protein n=1 Tax=Paraphaeosphaeria sporulosa TaxID=1460663 RepID=A0A177C7A1_9PLEO|nr:uncharacterized protein CC84DRAFT_939371 [Paraphaeosphaeria sporulosa]OAG03001.1 hypothetical protein CC84DRAFT_939371 [Paraphaeosphaeria sporulosa]
MRAISNFDHLLLEDSSIPEVSHASRKTLAPALNAIAVGLDLGRNASPILCSCLVFLKMTAVGEDVVPCLSDICRTCGIPWTYAFVSSAFLSTSSTIGRVAACAKIHATIFTISFTALVNAWSPTMLIPPLLHLERSHPRISQDLGFLYSARHMPSTSSCIVDWASNFNQIAWMRILHNMSTDECVVAPPYSL